MVYRRFNKPVGKLGNKDVYWLTEVITSEWVCRACFGKQPKSSVAMEVWVKGSRVVTMDSKTIADKARRIEGEKLWVCLKCAERLLEDALVKVRIVKERGKDVYRFMEDV